MVAELFGSGLEAEDRQWAWLATVLSGRPAHEPLVILSHKPLTGAPEDLSAAPASRFVPSGARRRLASLVQPHPALALSGHVHQGRELFADGIRHVWAPSTWAVLPDWAQPSLGSKRCGALMVALGDDDARVCSVEPPDLVQHTISVDVPDPYALHP